MRWSRMEERIQVRPRPRLNRFSGSPLNHFQNLAAPFCRVPRRYVRPWDFHLQADAPGRMRPAGG